MHYLIQTEKQCTRLRETEELLNRPMVISRKIISTRRKSAEFKMEY
jgi:hypothetical protein